MLLSDHEPSSEPSSPIEKTPYIVLGERAEKIGFPLGMLEAIINSWEKNEKEKQEKISFFLLLFGLSQLKHQYLLFRAILCYSKFSANISKVLAAAAICWMLPTSSFAAWAICAIIALT
ncbi:hypothetical protein SATMO3_36240 [Sporomusa aerivorans]